MITQFITLEIPLQPTPLATQQAIEAELQKHGDPLRWALTQVQGQLATIEAIVTLP